MPQKMFAQLNYIFPHPLKQFQQLCTCKELVDNSFCTLIKYGEYLQSCKSLAFYHGQTLHENQKLCDLFGFGFSQTLAIKQ